MTARRAHVFVLPHFALLLLLLAVELGNPAPLPDDSSINTNPLDRDDNGAFPKIPQANHNEILGDSKVTTPSGGSGRVSEENPNKLEDSTSAEDIGRASEENLEKHEDSKVTTSVSDSGRVSEENLDKLEDSISAEDSGRASEENLEKHEDSKVTTSVSDSGRVSEENLDKLEDSISAEDSGRASEENLEKYEDSKVTTSVRDSDRVLEENLDKHEDSKVTTSVGDSGRVSEENPNKLEDSKTTSAEDTGRASEENLEKHEDSKVTTSVADSDRVSEENLDNHKDSKPTSAEDSGYLEIYANSKVTMSAEDGDRMSEENPDKHEDSKPMSAEDRGNADKHANSKVTMSAEEDGDNVSEENSDTQDESKITVKAEDDDRVAKENLDQYSMTTKSEEDDSVELSFGTALTEEDKDGLSEENLKSSKKTETEKDGGNHQVVGISHPSASPDANIGEGLEKIQDNHSEAKAEESNEALKKTAPEGEDGDSGNNMDIHTEVDKKGDADKEINETENKEGGVLDEYNAKLENSEEDAPPNSSDIEDEAEAEGAVKNYQEMERSAHEENHNMVTYSSFAQLRTLPSENNRNLHEEQYISEQDVAGENDSSVIEETAEREAGSPDELIEDARMDSEVIKSDNKTIAMGKSMPFSGKEKSGVLPSNTSDSNVEDGGEGQESSVEHEGANIDNGEDSEEKNFLDGKEKNVEEHDMDEATEKDTSEETGSGVAPLKAELMLVADKNHKDEVETSSASKKNLEDEAKKELGQSKEHETNDDEFKEIDHSQTYSNIFAVAFEESTSGHEDKANEPAEEGEHTTESIVNAIGETDSKEHNALPELEDEIAAQKSLEEQETGYHLKEDYLAENETNVHVQVFSTDSVPLLEEDHHKLFDGSGEDETTTPASLGSDEVPNIPDEDFTDDDRPPSSKENTSAIGEASYAYQEKPVQQVIVPQLAAASLSPSTEIPCVTDEENEDCVHENASAIEGNSKSQDAVISSTSADELDRIPIEEVGSGTVIKDHEENIEDEDADNGTMANGGDPDTIVENSLGENAVQEVSGKMRAANVNEIGISGQQQPDDLTEAEALDSSNASGSYVVLGCIMAVVIVLLAYAAIKSRRERSIGSKKQKDVVGDDDDGTELKDMKKALLPPDTPHDDRNGDIEANKKPLVNNEENQEEEEPVMIKQNGTLDLSEPSREVDIQVDSSPAVNQSEQNKSPTKNARDKFFGVSNQMNGLSEVIVEKPAISNGNTDSTITQPVAAKVKVIENEDSIAKTPLIINRGGNSALH